MDNTTDFLEILKKVYKERFAVEVAALIPRTPKLVTKSPLEIRVEKIEKKLNLLGIDLND